MISSGNVLPPWLQYVQACAILFMTLVGAWIAYQQMEIAAAKLQHDFHEKRYRVFHAIRKALSNAAVQGNVTHDQLRRFVLDTGDAVFLLTLTLPTAALRACP